MSKRQFVSVVAPRFAYYEYHLADILKLLGLDPGAGVKRRYRWQNDTHDVSYVEGKSLHHFAPGFTLIRIEGWRRWLTPSEQDGINFRAGKIYDYHECKTGSSLTLIKDEHNATPEQAPRT